jgi:hypothetical protein
VTLGDNCFQFHTAIALSLPQSISRGIALLYSHTGAIHVLNAVITQQGDSIMTTPNIEENALQVAPIGEGQDQKVETKADKAPQKPKGGAVPAKGVATKGKASTKPTLAKKAPKGPKKAKAEKSEGAREGSKTATVLALIQRVKGATLAEIMEATSWQAHSVRGFISGTLGKKMRLKVESAKREDGTRFYSLSK